MKKTVLVIALLALVAVTLVAAHEFPSTLTVINKTEGNVIISLEYPYSFLVVRPDSTKKFTIERDTYDAIVTACGETTNGTMNLEHNLKLNFTPCPGWDQTSAPKYLGEPTMEKPNWNREPGVADWRFLY
jgi:hypothetical protein